MDSSLLIELIIASVSILGIIFSTRTSVKYLSKTMDKAIEKFTIKLENHELAHHELDKRIVRLETMGKQGKTNGKHK